MLINQLNAAHCPAKVYYGFAPFANFRSPKTADVARKIGIDRLVLETDYENYLDVRQQLKLNVLLFFFSNLFSCLRQTWLDSSLLYMPCFSLLTLSVMMLTSTLRKGG